ncbi:hypothetical protein FOL47_004633 [Perkinsus chesapeaki]|uniref:PIPK domain-containing protein n=1 Tax=Perkinsus chesapeaki TaxID=330153 RepID=A0A7J6M2T6_PERCH|nr:hypothetical protein FOL47_004633 [Perkinsus chesapeaki]
MSTSSTGGNPSRATAPGSDDDRYKGPSDAFRDALEVGHFAMWLRGTQDDSCVTMTLGVVNILEKVFALESLPLEVHFSRSVRKEMLHEVRHLSANAGLIGASDAEASIEEMMTAAWGKIEPLWRRFEADGGRNFVTDESGESTQASDSDLPGEGVRDNITNAPMTHKTRPKHLTGAKAVGVESANYALAYAMMVGIEAVVRSGEQVSIAKRSEERPQPGEEDTMEVENIMAAVRRNYILPPSGTRLSPPHISKPNKLVFEEAAPEIFQFIRARSCVGDEEYLSSLCQRGFSLIEFVTNSKSGEFFFFSHNGKFMLKTISDEEAETLLGMLKDYAHHVTSHRSLLTRMLGLYRLHIGALYKRWFFVSTSVFDTGSLGLHAQYDLKGSTSKNRRAGDTETVKKDLNWLREDMSLLVPDECKDILIATHKADVEFLAHHGVTDYSVLVGIHDTESSDAGVHTKGVKLLRKTALKKLLPMLRLVHASGRSSVNTTSSRTLTSELAVSRMREHVGNGWVWRGVHGPISFTNAPFRRHKYFIGIIDYLVPWNIKKRAERIMNGCLCQGQTSSCQSPSVYASRQHVFFADRVAGPHDGIPAIGASLLSDSEGIRSEETGLDMSGQVDLNPHVPVVESDGPASLPTVRIGFSGPYPFYAKAGEKIYGHDGPWTSQKADPHTVHATHAAAMIKELQNIAKSTDQAIRESKTHKVPLVKPAVPEKCVPWHLNLDMLRLRQAIEKAEEVEKVLTHDFHIAPFDAGALPRLDLEAVSAHPARFDDIHGHVRPVELQSLRHLRDHVTKVWDEVRTDKTLEGLSEETSKTIVRPFTEMKLSADSLYMHASKCLFPPHRLPDAFSSNMHSLVSPATQAFLYLKNVCLRSVQQLSTLIHRLNYTQFHSV